MFSAALLCGALLSAQNLNPEVQVTNDYVSTLSGMPKQGISMIIPDSLHRFDYHFDYSVFDSPYKGSYEFSPYSVTVKPDANPFDGRKLYASLGAGYALRPELDVLWTPVRKDKFTLSVAGKGRGFYGQYRTVDSELSATGLGEKGQYDFSGHGSLDGQAWFGTSTLKFDVGYDGIFTGPWLCPSDNYHSAFASARLLSTDNASSRFYYDIGLAYRFSNDSYVTDNHFVVDGKFGGKFTRRALSCLVDFNLVSNRFYSGLDVAPHVDLSLGSVDLRLGARAGFDYKAGEDPQHSIKLYPDVTASINLVRNHLQVFGFLTGGPQYNSYFDLKSFDHYFHSNSLEVSKNRLDIGAGVRGQISSRVQFGVKTGFKFLESMPLYTVKPSAGGVYPGFQQLDFVDYNTFYVDATAKWKSERLDIDGKLLYYADALSVSSGHFAPSPLSGGLHLKYNWDRRVFFGIGADAASHRSTNITTPAGEINCTIPWYVDLGAVLEFRFARGWSAWLKGGNLLNMDIRRTPLYSEFGVSGIAGVSLIL